MLPATRIEMMLAQVAKLVVQSQGAMQDASLADFLLRPAEASEPEITAEIGAGIIAGMTGAKVIYIGKKKGSDGSVAR